MHGIFFGSDDEIQFAHEEGFLFELFRDTGFYTLKEMPPSLVNISNYTISVNNSRLEKRDNSSVDFEEVLNNMENEYFSTDPTEDYSFAIQKIVHENVVDEKFDVICWIFLVSYRIWFKIFKFFFTDNKKVQERIKYRDDKKIKNFSKHIIRIISGFEQRRFIYKLNQ